MIKVIHHSDELGFGETIGFCKMWPFLKGMKSSVGRIIKIPKMKGMDTAPLKEKAEEDFLKREGIEVVEVRLDFIFHGGEIPIKEPVLIVENREDAEYLYGFDSIL